MNISKYWEYIEWNYAYKMQNFSSFWHLHYVFLRTCGMKLSVYRPIISALRLFMYWEYVEWNCPHGENTSNAWKFQKHSTGRRSSDGFPWPHQIKTKISCKCAFKGTETRDCNCVKAVWFDRPWLGESSADIHNFLNCPLNFTLN